MLYLIEVKLNQTIRWHRLLLTIIALEDQLKKQNPVNELTNSSNQTTSGVYQRGVPVHSQQLFTTAIHTALKQVDIHFRLSIPLLLNRKNDKTPVFWGFLYRNRYAGSIRNSPVFWLLVFPFWADPCPPYWMWLCPRCVGIWNPWALLVPTLVPTISSRKLKPWRPCATTCWLISILQDRQLWPDRAACSADSAGHR